MKNRVVIIGIDSMDSFLVDNYIEELPNFQLLKQSCPDIKMKSVFPPDSDTAWATIYTGLNPAEHGIVTFVDPLEKSIHIQTTEQGPEELKGRTFWDVAGREGKKTCVLMPHICYPPWEINGVMISKSRITGEILSFPGNFDRYPLSHLVSPVGVPKKDNKNLEKLVQQYETVVKNEIEFFLTMYKSDQWDLFFCYSSALDAIQHYFWNYSFGEKSHQNTQFKSIIKDFYRIYDSLIGQFLPVLDDDTSMIVLSDHGHGGRPKILININEILRRNGYLAGHTKRNPVKSIKKNVNALAINMIGKYDLGWFASKFIRKFSFLQKNLTFSGFSPDLSQAYITDLSGIKAYSYGGIIINKKLILNNEYDSKREQIIQLLKKELENKYEWIMKREDLYTGEFIERYPDILILLKEEYGLGNQIQCPILTEAYSSNIVPGSHKGETPIIFVHNVKKKIDPGELNLMNVYSLVLKILHD